MDSGARDFKLKSIDGKTYKLADARFHFDSHPAIIRFRTNEVRALSRTAFVDPVPAEEITLPGGVEVLWSYWFIALLPSSILTVLVAWWLTLKLYRLDGGYDYLRAELRKMGPLSAREKRAALLLAAVVLLWLTDFLHHISPAVIGIGAGLFALLPRV